MSENQTRAMEFPDLRWRSRKVRAQVPAASTGTRPDRPWEQERQSIPVYIGRRKVANT